MPEPFLLEIGCEEIPARMVAGLARQLADKLNQYLNESGLAELPGVPYFTPRRLIFCHPGVRDRQPLSEVEIQGPPARLAIAPDGSFTPQALAFATKAGAAASGLYRVTTPKGEYVAIRRQQGGATAASLLADLIPRVFTGLDLPRSMNWGTDGLRFIRPVRWALALLGSTPVPFQLGSLASGQRSWGHRTLGQEFSVTSASDFPGLWKRNFVMPDPAERRAAILQAAGAHLPPASTLRHDQNLLDTLVNLTEWPDALAGQFAATYLGALPAEVLVTVMRDHQKYFAVEDSDGMLAPNFVVVINQSGDAQGLIRHGNERVLRARFSDAQFFWNQDRKLPLPERLPLLEQVTFQAKLGSYRAKSRRLRALAAWLAGQWPAAEVDAAAEAAELAKCDLTTDMVKEFPELQGVMGGYYAQAGGSSPAVVGAIADQYAWDAAPRSDTAAAVSVADKLDTVVGMFAIGEVPSGSADPYGLRRLGNGIVRTLIERKLPLELSGAVAHAGAGYDPALPSDPAAALTGFFRDRQAFYLTESAGFAPAIAAAVLAAGSGQPLDAFRRAQALAATPNTAAVAAVVKRARSIVRKEKWESRQFDPARLTAPAGIALHAAVSALPDSGDYAAELAAIATLADPLDRFFNEVRVNDPDPAIRANRLGLLAWAVDRLSRVADFSELAVA